VQRLLVYGAVVLAVFVLCPDMPRVWGQANDPHKKDDKNKTNRPSSGGNNHPNNSGTGNSHQNNNGNNGADNNHPSNHGNIGAGNNPSGNSSSGHSDHGGANNQPGGRNNGRPANNNNALSGNHPESGKDGPETELGSHPGGLKKNPLESGKPGVSGPETLGSNIPGKPGAGTRSGSLKKNPLGSGKPGSAGPEKPGHGISNTDAPAMAGPRTPGGGRQGGPGPKPGGGLHHPGPNGLWDQHEWELAWRRHWYHEHPIWWHDGWHWWDPDASRYVVWVEGESIPEDVYVVVEQPPQPASPPTKQFTGEPIRIINSRTNDITLNYTINDNPYEIKPGESQTLEDNYTWVVEFDRGGDFGEARYTLEPGEYSFALSEHGWELYHKFPTTNAATEPPAPVAQ
jgi:hypothetical protein